MIVQGSNLPLILVVKYSGNIENLGVSLFNSNHKELKHWSLEDVTINGSNIICPLTQEETLHFDKGICTIELKILNDSGAIIVNAIDRDFICTRDDRHILGDDSINTDSNKIPEIHMSVVSGLFICGVDGGTYEDWMKGDD